MLITLADCVVLPCAALCCAVPLCLTAVLRYGLVYAGIGWVCWRTPQDVPDEVGLMSRVRNVYRDTYVEDDGPVLAAPSEVGVQQLPSARQQLR
jgi:hypothetical protein